MPANRDHFPGYPTLRRVAHSGRYGRMELIEVNKTSDGFLIGQAMIGPENSPDRYLHSVFLGRSEDFPRHQPAAAKVRKLRHV